MIDTSDICKKLNQNQIGCYPCDTMWGLIGLMSTTAAKHLRTIKTRDQSQGFIVLIPDKSYLDRLCLTLSTDTLSLIESYWPGPLTLILPKKPSISSIITGSSDSIAVRLPGKSPIYDLLKTLKHPLLSTSVNTSGHPPIHTIDDLPLDFKQKLAFCCKPKSTHSNQASTIVNTLHSPPIIIRQGQLILRLD